MFNVSGHPRGVTKEYIPGLRSDINLTIDILDQARACTPLQISSRLENLQNFFNVIDIQLLDKSVTDGQYILAYTFIRLVLTSLTSEKIRLIADEVNTFINLYNYLGTPNLSFRYGSTDFLRNSRICLNSNLSYLELKKLIPNTSANYNASNILYYDKFWNKPVDYTFDEITYPEYNYHMYHSKIGIFCVGVTIIGLYFFYKT